MVISTLSVYQEISKIEKTYDNNDTPSGIRIGILLVCNTLRKWLDENGK